MLSHTVEPLETRIVRSATLGTGGLLVEGTPGNDQIAVTYDNASSQTIVSVNGVQQTFAGEHSVRIQAGDGDDTVTVSLPSQVDAGVEGGNGNDAISSDVRCVLWGGPGDDTLRGSAANDHIHGNEGNDVISGGDGYDKLYGGDGNDTMYGNGGSDRMFGDAGNDRMLGNAGNDWVIGQAGNDHVYGNAGNDFAYGGGYELSQAGQDDIDLVVP